jgi:hypothetical protein
MKPIKAFSKAFLLPAAVVLGSSGLHAETITQSNGVTTIRGVDDAASAEQRQISRGRAGVTVFRGTSTPHAQTAVASEAPAPQRLQIKSGRNLWLYDAESKQITACSLWYDSYGNRSVRCDSDQY